MKYRKLKFIFFKLLEKYLLKERESGFSVRFKIYLPRK